MSIVVRCTAELTDWINPSTVEFDYGEVTDDLFVLDELLENSDVDLSKCVLHMYPLSGNDQHLLTATHLVAISLGNDKKVGKMVMFDKVVDGPFLLLPAMGNKLKGFYSHDCAEQWVHWFVGIQNFWKEIHHASRSPKDKVTKSIH